MYPKIALIGRTNVGKSTLFNLLIEEDKSTISKIAGTTRDLVTGTCNWQGAIFNIIDTGGIQFIKQDQLVLETLNQTKKAIKQADLLIMLIDAKEGITSEDRRIAKILKLSQKPYIFVANKADSPKLRQKETEFKSLGIGAPLFISSVTGSGTGDMLDEVVKKLKKLNLLKKEKTLENVIKVGILGKPNVGKSSLLNSLSGQKRAIVSEIAHTTRDLIDIMVEHGNQNFLFIDTPGIRRKAKIQKGIEKNTIEKSLLTAKKSDVVLLTTDIKDITKQDKNLIAEITKTKAGIIIIANKWDLVEDKTTKAQKEVEKIYHDIFPFLTWAPIIFISAKYNEKTNKIFELINQVYKNKFFTAKQEDLDFLLSKMTKRRRPPRQKTGKPTYFYKLEQTGTNPLRFCLTANEKTLDPSYFRFMERMIREEFKLIGVSITVDIEKKERERK